ncbi:MAG: hypothetical protein K8F91_21620 [Candidatus Obscuribacterales bacterium]|nr:hypothetical protein [Candidatus Obscuribacterales bacterium]
MKRTQSRTSARNQLGQMIMGGWVAQMISVCARLNIADHLKDGPLSALDLAKLTEVDEEALYRTLRALTASGLFYKDEKGRFGLTDCGYYLQSDVEGSAQAMAAMTGDPSHWLPWGKAFDAVKTGKPVGEDVFGSSIWDYLSQSQNKDQLERFNQAMTQSSLHITRIIADAYDFSRHTTLVDIGGGQGGLLSGILGAFPALNGILFDLPQVLESIQDSDWRKDTRMSLVAGSFLESVPAGADAYIMKHIIHDWGDADCIKILENIREEIADNGSLLIAETVLDGNSGHFANWLDLNMMVILGGKERTVEEYDQLLAGADFKLVQVIQTGSHISLLQGKPV